MPAKNLTPISPDDARRMILDQFRNNRHRYLGFLIPITHSMEDAEDIIQEAYYRSHRYPPRMVGNDALHSWVWVVVRSCMLDWIKKTQRRTSVVEPMTRVSYCFDGDYDYELLDYTSSSSAQTPSIEAQLEAREALDAIEAYFPEHHRPCFQLYRQGYSLKDICGILGLHLHQVKTRLYKPLRALRANDEFQAQYVV